jgi:hypothetical protein
MLDTYDLPWIVLQTPRLVLRGIQRTFLPIPSDEIGPG